MDLDDPGVQFSPKSEDSSDKKHVKRLLETIRVLREQIKGKDKQLIYKDTQLELYRTKQKVTQNHNRSLQSQLRTSKQEIAKIKSKKLSNDQKKDIVKEALLPFFDQSQVNLFLKGSWTRGRNFSLEVLTMALTLKTISTKAYNFLRKKKILPLPGKSTIVRHFKNFQIEPGFLECVGTLLKVKAATLTKSVDKVVGLQLDEVYVKKDISYNPTRDQVVGVHTKCNMLLLRGIFLNYKIPIWYRFDTAMDKTELDDIVKKLEDISYHVVCLTCDNGGDNVGLASSLGVSDETPYFQHPTREGEKIYFFFDQCHLIKLMRNHILEKGFVLQDGSEIGRKQFEDLYKELGTCEQTDMKICHKLTAKHLYPKNQEKQCVRTAVQIFSSSVADAINFLSFEDPSMTALANFCQVADN